jgi:hypothetical protein
LLGRDFPNTTEKISLALLEGEQENADIVIGNGLQSSFHPLLLPILVLITS